MNEYAVDTPDNLVDAKRPTFLTVLCILTFVVSGYHVIMAIIDLFTSKSFDPEQWQDISNQMGEAMSGADSASQEMAAQMMTALSSMMQAGIDNAVALGITALVASALSILGAYWMFKLKKMGYYTYIVAKVIGIIIPIIIFGVNILTIMMYGFIALIAVLFIVLYGINRKYMR
ncbi:hypothetical protein G3O08_10615 [Cryomorpha ignava]|uniref:DUF4064 domain-containing protein n=1 Tax=Cryomorpha ignava TaxID=101383 RepID=A0A7K3WSA9_9FLAO|nr:hypothetical protein [Cryomorpha ignava]NEN23951.1 hypothetical protein [Cryomorpha ignava]